MILWIKAKLNHLTFEYPTARFPVDAKICISRTYASARLSPQQLLRQKRAHWRAQAGTDLRSRSRRLGYWGSRVVTRFKSKRHQHRRDSSDLEIYTYHPYLLDGSQTHLMIFTKPKHAKRESCKKAAGGCSTTRLFKAHKKIQSLTILLLWK